MTFEFSPEMKWRWFSCPFVCRQGQMAFWEDIVSIPEPMFPERSSMFPVGRQKNRLGTHRTSCMPELSAYLNLPKKG